MEFDLPTLKRQLAQLQELHDAGALPAAQFQESKALLERRILDLVLSGTVQPAAPQAAHATVAAAPAQASVRIGSWSQRKLWMGLAAGVLGIAIAGYMWKGSPSYLGVGPAAGSSVQANAGAAAETPAHRTDAEQIAAMVERLAARMKEQPQDAEGWAMLARSYTVLGRHADALEAYQKAVTLRGDDAQLLADYADSLAVKNNRVLTGDPMKAVEKALKIDPKNVKALALAGTDAFVRKDFAGAVKYWEKVVQFAPADSSYGKQIEASLAEARELAGLPARPVVAANAASPAVVPAPAGAPAAAGQAVSGTVSLLPALASLASPNDTVFVFARSADGGRMPLAILRKQVKDLPFQFTLDDSQAMSPAAKISGASSLTIQARVSKSGEALPQNGDLSGQIGPVKLGATGLKLEIREAIKQ